MKIQLMEIKRIILFFIVATLSILFMENIYKIQYHFDDLIYGGQFIEFKDHTGVLKISQSKKQCCYIDFKFKYFQKSPDDKEQYRREYCTMDHNKSINCKNGYSYRGKYIAFADKLLVDSKNNETLKTTKGGGVFTYKYDKMKNSDNIFILKKVGDVIYKNKKSLYFNDDEYFILEGSGDNCIKEKFLFYPGNYDLVSKNCVALRKNILNIECEDTWSVDSFFKKFLKNKSLCE